MQKIIKILQKYKVVLIVVILAVPTFYSMLKFGIYSMQDFHFFRQFEFDKCIKAFQIPCRWSPDAGLGYGEPLFNFYGQLPYVVGEIYYLLTGSFVGSIKFLFALSLIGSAISMFFLAKKVWQNDYSALVSATIYLYAPYRAVDVWVRAALPEAMAFILFPLIILGIEKKSLSWFTVLLSLLILTHNLSLIMFLPILLVWIIYRKYWQAVWGFLGAILISSFYILPLVFESKYIDLLSTTRGYFDFRAHFVTLSQIFFDRSWGYGGSTWGSGDGLNLSVGQIQWVVPVIVFSLVLIKKKISISKNFLILFGLGFFYIFLSHNKSTFIWTHIPQMAYIQFPWRFYGVATFCLSLSSGALVQFFEKQKLILTVVTVAIVIALNYSFFHEDIWYKVNDSYFTTGEEWVRQRTASIGDYWPQFGHVIPTVPSSGEYINYFPGWVGAIPDNSGLIPASGTKFTDTPIRKFGNIISLVSLFGFGFVLRKNKIWKKED